MTLTAKFSGKCTKCGGVIPAGMKCEWERGAGVRHVGECPKAAQAAAAPAATVQMGVFRKDGKIYVVKPNREKTRFYAKEIVESPARMTEAGAVVDFEAVYRPGVIYKLTETDRWDLADAHDFLTKFARCIVCGRHLKAAKSVAGAIGPVCAKYFAHRHNGAASTPKVTLADIKRAEGRETDRQIQEYLDERAEERAGEYWVDDSGRAHTEPEPGVC
jgi:hypothetical protein